MVLSMLYSFKGFVKHFVKLANTFRTLKSTVCQAYRNGTNGCVPGFATVPCFSLCRNQFPGFDPFSGNSLLLFFPEELERVWMERTDVAGMAALHAPVSEQVIEAALKPKQMVDLFCTCCVILRHFKTPKLQGEPSPRGPGLG